MNKIDERLKFKKNDIILFSFSIITIVTIFLISFFSVNKTENKHVEIKYKNNLLFDKNDINKSTSISFPENGTKKISFTSLDKEIYNLDFSFDSVTITLYSDKSIQILEEDITCEDRICSKMGRIYASNTPIVCLPNMIQVMIVGDDFPESVN